jgi:hypothetical protein
MESTQGKRRRAFRLRLPVEIWEDPQRPFPCSVAAVQRYIEAERWDLVFNVLALTVRPPYAE